MSPTKQSHLRQAVCFLIVAWLVTFVPARAQVVNVWTNLSGGYWETPGNWSAGAPSIAQSVLYLTNAGSKSVVVTDGGVPDSVKAISNLVISAAVGNTNTLRLEAISSGVNQFSVLNGLTLRRGGELLVAGYITNRVDGVSGGAFDVDGSVRALSGVMITTNVSTRIGNSSNGTMLVDGGQWQAGELALGYLLGSTGKLTVASGSATLSGQLRIAPAASSAGTAVLSGGQFTATNATSFIGLYGNASGTMNVSNNAVWRGRDVYVAYYGGAKGTLNVAGGTNMISDSLTLGNSLNATGTLYAAGGQLFLTNASGNARLVIGRDGDGLFRLDGATVAADQLIATNGGSSRIQFDRGNLTTRSAIVSNTVNMQAGNWQMLGGTNRLSTVAVSWGIAAKAASVSVHGGQLDGSFVVGSDGTGILLVSNATWAADTVMLGRYASGSSGTATILDGTTTIRGLTVGQAGTANQLLVSGGQLNLGSMVVGTGSSPAGWGNVTFSNLLWRAGGVVLGGMPNTIGRLHLRGSSGVITNQLTLGSFEFATGSADIDSGELAVTNAAGTARLQIGAGKYQSIAGICELGLSGGTVLADQLVISNYSLRLGDAQGRLSFRRGILSTRGTLIHNGYDVVLGDSNAPAATWLMHDGVHQLEQDRTAAFASDPLMALRLGPKPASTGILSLTSGTLLTFSNVPVIVGDAGVGQMTVSGGTWSARSVVVGCSNGSQGTLTLSGGTTVISSNLTLGATGCGASGMVEVAGGQIFVTNSTHDATLDVRSGELYLLSGSLTVDRLILTNACGLIRRGHGSVTYSTLVLDPNLSATGDGLPNWWKQKYRFNPLLSSGNNGPNADPDKDGMSNMQEYLAGTNPTNAASCVRITEIRRVGNDIQIVWTAAGPRTNYLQATAGSPDPTSFQDIGPPIVLPAVQDYQLTGWDTAPGSIWPARYYRIRVGP